MNKIKIICSDIEGCLREGDKFIPNNLTELQKIQEYQLQALDNSNLPPIVLCSGRGIGFVEGMFTNIGFPPINFWSVAENGVFIFDARSNKLELNPAVNKNIIKLQEISQEIIPKLLKEISGGREPGKEICISLNPPDRMKIEEFFEIVKKRLSQFEKAVELTHSTTAVDITPKGANKESGLKFATKKSGVELGNILYIGDTKGDFPAFEIAGYTACPSNATKGCKKLVESKSGYISSFSDVKGLADIISRFTKYKFE
ncbi:MAG: HAD-IIB family hydrolase [Candidatus Pacebacteria bacterium]|nr:HAD-IIB family hydrolase [Candidatus Paceibacterota bacterium]